MSNTPMLNLQTVSLMLNVKQGSCEYQFLKSFGIARQGNEPRPSDCKADALTTTLSLLPSYHHGSIKRGKPARQKIKNDRPEQRALALLGSKFC